MPTARNNIDLVLAAIAEIGTITAITIEGNAQTDKLLFAIVEVTVKKRRLAVKFAASNIDGNVIRNGRAYCAAEVGEVLKGELWLKLDLFGLM